MTDDSPSALVAAVLAEEASRQAEQDARSQEVVLPDDLLPGVGAEQMSLRATLRAGGWVTLLLIVGFSIVEQFSREATSILAPDIQTTFGISDTTLIGIASFGGVALVLGAVPLAWLADRVPRKRIIVISAAGGAVALVAAGLAANPFQLFWAYSALGFATAYSNPVFSSLLADQYPLGGRGKAFAIYAMATPVGLTGGPFLAGAVADVAGGTEGWRWAYVIVAIPVALLAVVAALFMREPKRGQYEQQMILGDSDGGLDGDIETTVAEQPVLASSARPELPITIGTAYARMKKIKTFYFICVGIGVLGLALITVPLQLSLLLRDGYGYGAYSRGWMMALCQIPSIVAIVVGGYLYDRVFRTNPERVVRIAGGCILAYGLLIVIGLRMQPIGALLAFHALASACNGVAIAGVGPIVAAVAPYRLRSQAFAIVPVFTFLMGGFLGGLVAGSLSDAHGQRTALTIVVPVSTVIGGVLFFRGARYLKRDISLAVEELIEEQAEQRRTTAAALNAAETPVLQVRNLDVSYGPVQVLFDVGLEVQRGEVVALLGTNGAGKSTLLRTISGLGIPDRGVVRLNGQALTYVEAEVRFKVGVVQLRGGAGVFGDMTVAENLRTALLSSRLNGDEIAVRIERAVEQFPALASRLCDDASDLSGGQQQMLALAMALVHEPEILLIDELSLGLAPVVVQELLAVVERLKAAGMTMIIVEQSLNLALSFADRAIFMEKGRVRFEGPARELLDRGDLVRAVFLGAA